LLENVQKFGNNIEIWKLEYIQNEIDWFCGACHLFQLSFARISDKLVITL